MQLSPREALDAELDSSSRLPLQMLFRVPKDIWLAAAEIADHSDGMAVSILSFFVFDLSLFYQGSTVSLNSKSCSFTVARWFVALVQRSVKLVLHRLLFLPCSRRNDFERVG